MLIACLKSLALMTVITSLWLVVQRSWLADSGDQEPGSDALAGRTGCHGCRCEQNHCNQPDLQEESDHAPGRL